MGICDRGLWAVVVCSLLAGPLAAQEARGIALDVIFLGAPTEWCAATDGVPMSVTMDGPDIIKGPDEPPTRVIVRRGLEWNQTFVGKDARRFFREKNEGGSDDEIIGRFSAKFQSCVGAFERPVAAGSWRIVGADGRDTDAGEFEGEGIYMPLFVPFFGSFVGFDTKVYYAEFDGKRHYTRSRYVTTTNQIFLAEPDNGVTP